MIIVLDIDETLVHTHEGDHKDFDFSGLSVKKRPGLDEFLQELFETGFYQVGVWSAGMREYVEHVVKTVFPCPPQFILARENCDCRYNKPLGKIRSLIHDDNKPYNSDISEILLIDDKLNVAPSDTFNHLMIKPFTLGQDSELKRLIAYLHDNAGKSARWLSMHWK